jgi:hypothetical protein
VHGAPRATRRQVGSQATDCQSLPETQRFEVREVKATDCIGHVAERVAAGITIDHGIMSSAGAHAVEDDEDRATWRPWYV